MNGTLFHPKNAKKAALMIMISTLSVLQLRCCVRWTHLGRKTVVLIYFGANRSDDDYVIVDNDVE